MIHLFFQWKDRGFKSELRVGNTDEVNTTKLIQPDLHNLYTNYELPAAYIYA